MTLIPSAPPEPVADVIETTHATNDAPPNGAGFVAAVRDFFHGAEAPYRLALIRICLAFTILFPTAYRWYYSREIFSTDGSGVSLWSIYDYPCPWLEPNGTAAVFIHSVVILALVTTCLGWCTRLSLVLAATGYTYLNMCDVLSTLNKSSAIASHFLLLLCFTHCGSVWSVDSWLARRRLLRQGVSPDQLPAPPLGARWPRRLIQLMLATVYFSASVTKLEIRNYFTGEHLQTWMLSTIHTPNLLGGTMAFHPALIVVGAYATALWEMLFLFVVWKPTLRRVTLGLGAFFHLMTFLTLGLIIFPMICVSAYPAFATDGEIEWFGGRATALRNWIANLFGTSLSASGRRRGMESWHLRRALGDDRRERRRARVQARSLRPASTGRSLSAPRTVLRGSLAAPGPRSSHRGRRQGAQLRHRLDVLGRLPGRSPHHVPPGRDRASAVRADSAARKLVDSMQPA